MRVYHSSTCEVSRPDTHHSRDYLDFGRGFYVTTLKDQATSYAKRFTRRGRKAFLNTYLLDELLLANFRVRRFDAYDEEWLDFVMTCRKGEDTSDWDVVVGGIANDRVFTTVDLYFSGEMSKRDALGRLAYEKPNDQLCIRTQEALDALLAFEGAEEVI
ncbi:MAG: DUF3990 domain-containing protein [Eggerthellaceae bacterium]|nr:DUF3990 domain-containing protein [Eggerthellaceae bacterium]